MIALLNDIIDSWLHKYIEIMLRQECEAIYDEHYIPLIGQSSIIKSILMWY